MNDWFLALWCILLAMGITFWIYELNQFSQNFLDFPLISPLWKFHDSEIWQGLIKHFCLQCLWLKQQSTLGSNWLVRYCVEHSFCVRPHKETLLLTAPYNRISKSQDETADLLFVLDLTVEYSFKQIYIVTGVSRSLLWWQWFKAWKNPFKFRVLYVTIPDKVNTAWLHFPSVLTSPSINILINANRKGDKLSSWFL